jgi:hypothetical protein
MVAGETRNLRQYLDCPISLRFAFLVASLPGQARDLARKFVPLPSYETVQNHYGPQITRIMAHLSDSAELADFIGHEMEAHAITRGAVVSLAIDAMAMRAQHNKPSSGQEVRKWLSCFFYNLWMRD